MKYKIGDKSNCSLCGREIVYFGYWAHVGVEYRHIASPVEAETTVINGDVVGGDNLVGGKGVDVDAIIAAKLSAKKAEIEREADEDSQSAQTPRRSGGVTISGGTITIGGRVVDGDLITRK